MTIEATRRRNPRGGIPIVDYEAGFSASYVDVVHELALLGADEPQIASALAIGHDTLKRWRKLHPDLDEALNNGRMVADAKVAASLYRRALGFYKKETDVRAVDGEIILTEYEKYYAPDTTACIFWLKNRQKQYWRDKWELGVTDKEGKDVVPTDPVEAARRIAFALTRGAVAKESQDG